MNETIRLKGTYKKRIALSFAPSLIIACSMFGEWLSQREVWYLVFACTLLGIGLCCIAFAWSPWTVRIDGGCLYVRRTEIRADRIQSWTRTNAREIEIVFNWMTVLKIKGTPEQIDRIAEALSHLKGKGMIG